MTSYNKIKSIAIIGEGKMGTNLFYYLLDFGFDLIWICSNEAPLDKIMRTFEKKIKRLLDAGIIDETTHARLKSDTLISSDLYFLKSCDLIIEAIPENLELKRNLFAKLETIASSNCILASNSSSINPSELLPTANLKNRLIGLHFFYPVALKNIVEFITTKYTSKEVIEKTGIFLSAINREYILLKEIDSFILNKIYLDFQNEAFLVVDEGKISIRQMDALIKKYIFPSGAFDFCDIVGIDIMLTSVRNYSRYYSNTDHYLKFTLELQRMMNESRLGVKSGAGFYSYPLEENDNDLILYDIDKDLVEKIRKRLQFTMTSSINGFSSRSGISPGILNKMMKEYLDSETDLLTFQD